MFFRRSKPRPLLLALAAALTLIYLLYPSPAPPPPEAPESVRLAWHMNHLPPRPTFRKSTIDFRRRRPENPPPLPASKPPPPRPDPLPRIQHDFPEAPPPGSRAEARRREVRALFVRDWAAYCDHAWAADALLPLSLGPTEQFNGWAATLVDSLDTLYLLGLRAEFDEAVERVAQINFGSSTAARVNTFETTIRYLGGLLSAHDLSGRPVLLRKAVELGDLLLVAFDTPSRLPVDWIDFRRAKDGRGLLPEGRVVSAAAGTLSLEMTRLSQVTGDPRYFDAVSRISHLFAAGQNDTAIPGLWPMYVSMSHEDVVTGRFFTLGGGADSLYEYLPKMHLLLGGGDPIYESMTRGFLNATSAHLLFRPMLPPGVEDDILISGNVQVDREGNSPVLEPETEHLTCFVGGAFALAGRLLSDPVAVENGARLARGCAYLYRAFASGIMPERLTMVPCPPSASPSASASYPSCEWNSTLYDEETQARREWKEGTPLPFSSIKDPRYLLRPEAIESLFVLYRVTGDEAFADMAWEMFMAVRGGTSTGVASAAVKDVTEVGELEKMDYMESFWFAETLKYFYLIFSPPSLISLDEYVLNTEAHPFRLPSTR
ncbi:related to alpha-mannosidase IC (MNSIC) [Cephalotrichum gorgonifer]|uniref:alpha-1,2-Mannosidase n=1 Tax=Cephalotrichum gorgonifer TaxID=2041049 RepID=A0AAE8SWK3_9PEZI|nr:related to alpha-mannosidase IC (MNSIC) [Cephalotrichum gorgonifer]